MNLKALDLSLLTRLTSQHVDHVTCLECCKYYIAPETAACGHTLCHTCWRGRRTCPSCAAPIEKQLLKHNLSMQTLTQHIQTMADQFEKLFNIKLDDFDLDMPNIETKVSNDPTKNVKDWLASSQNHFSEPLLNSESCTQDTPVPVQLTPSKVQIHSSSKKTLNLPKVAYVPPPQDDWDKIEQPQDKEENIADKENVAFKNKSQIQLNNEYTMENPRRSSRKRDANTNESDKKTNTSLDKQSSKNSSLEIDKNNVKAKQNWNNVKRMRKEFSKLNKINRNKLNVSIEMCKKTKSAIIKPNSELEQQKVIEVESQPALYTIEDNTPVIEQPTEIINKDNILQETVQNIVNDNETSKQTENFNVLNTKTKNSIAVSNNTKSNCESVHDVHKSLSPSLINRDDSNNSRKMPFIKKSTLCPQIKEDTITKTININNNIPESASNDDIEITIKIGNTLTNIVIKKKNNDVQLKVNADREVQTSLGPNPIVVANEINPDLETNDVQNIEINLASNENNTGSLGITLKNNADAVVTSKTAIEKKNTASAETTTAQFEITESVEKELSNIMECEEGEAIANINTEVGNKISPPKEPNNTNVHTSSVEYIEDVDIFDNPSDQQASEQHVQLLKNMPSEILVPTVNSTKMNISNKRNREMNSDDEISSAKKLKSTNIDKPSSEVSIKNNLENKASDDSMNYDVVINQVFANIDADIQQSQKNKSLDKNEQPYLQNDIVSQRINIKNMSLSNNPPRVKEISNEKYSENMFSITGKEIDVTENRKKDDEAETQHTVSNLLTPVMCENLLAADRSVAANTEGVQKEVLTPCLDPDDSDRSIVEETPQKNVRLSKQINKNELSSNKKDSEETKKIIINVSDSVVEPDKSSNKNVTIIDAARKMTSETPLTINKFVDDIKHKSTPVARKSLNFDTQGKDDDEPEQTLCPSLVVAKTTQEKEFMSKAFEQTLKSPVNKPLLEPNIKLNDMKFCLAGSCLAPADLANVKLLCRKRNWKYVDKYTKELTHLVVSVDEENKSQRSVKYMCALAASKWIVSYQWVEACLKTNLVLGENHYEVLDGTGEPGPKRSRLARRKLFQGITFYCMPPFSVLDANILKEMLESSGGRVVNEAKAVKAISDAPALLLAEPEHTQEDRFMYIALELTIVPVNYEWVLNCLGSYSLNSIHDLLLCPASILPPATAKWPHVLMSRDND